jgi:hypothetical protein
MARDCSGTTTLIVTGATLTPLNDLGPGLYETQPGGLYPDGENTRPGGHTKAGIAIAETIRDNPLDTTGAVDTDDGVILFMSLGMSNCAYEWSQFVETIQAERSDINPKVRFFGGAAGSQTIEEMDDFADPYWASLAASLTAAGHSLAQVRVVWFQNDYNVYPAGAFLAYMNTMGEDLMRIMQLLHVYCPNCLQVYCTSRIYAGYTDTVNRTEPNCYWGGWALKLLIQEQILGRSTHIFDPDLGTVTMPWLSWGPYTWGDGINDRYDGLEWICNDFQIDDGYHPSSTGMQKVADKLLEYFSRDPAATPWLFT